MDYLEVNKLPLTPYLHSNYFTIISYLLLLLWDPNIFADSSEYFSAELIV